MNDDTHISVPDDMGGGTGEPTASSGERTRDDRPMTPAQASYLKTLASQAGVPVDLNLTERAAAKKISDLERRTGRSSRGI